MTIFDLILYIGIIIIGITIYFLLRFIKAMNEADKELIDRETYCEE